MSLSPVYATYNWKADPIFDENKFCPRCGNAVRIEEIAGKLRLVCQSCTNIQFRNPAPGIAVLVVQGNRVLLGLRKDAPGQGKWAIPSGYIEWDEDYLSAARREVSEETGLRVDICQVLHVESAFLSPRLHFLSIYLLAEPVGGSLVAGDDLLQVDWFPLQGPFPEMAFETDRNLAVAYVAGELPGLPVRLN